MMNSLWYQKGEILGWLVLGLYVSLRAVTDKVNLYDDLQHLQRFIPTYYHTFYYNLLYNLYLNDILLLWHA